MAADANAPSSLDAREFEIAVDPDRSPRRAGRQSNAQQGAVSGECGGAPGPETSPRKRLNESTTPPRFLKASLTAEQGFGNLNLRFGTTAKSRSARRLRRGG